MASSKAKTVEEYLMELPANRRATVTAVRDVIIANLPDGYVETMNWGMICYEVPLSRYHDTYNGKPLMYAALAAQKHHYAVYLTTVYQNQEKYKQLVDAYNTLGKKPDMGKSCIRFKRLEDLPLDTIGRLIAGTDVDTFIDIYMQSRQKASP